MTIYIGGYEECPPRSFRIEYWYNRRDRAWVVQVFDDQNRQHDSEYCPDKEWRDSAIEDFCKQYSTRDVRKV